MDGHQTFNKKGERSLKLAPTPSFVLYKYGRRSQAGTCDFKMSARLLVTVASGASAVVIVVCLIAAAALLQDINNFYDDIIDDMEQFKVRPPFLEAVGVPQRNFAKVSEIEHVTMRLLLVGFPLASCEFKYPCFSRSPTKHGEIWSCLMAAFHHVKKLELFLEELRERSTLSVRVISPRGNALLDRQVSQDSLEKRAKMALMAYLDGLEHQESV